MKHISGLVVSIFCFFSVSAQKNIPSFGKIDKADLEMKDCDFDPGAVAVKLLDIGNMFYDRGTAGITLFKTVYEKRVRIKILKDKGLSYANVEVPFYSHNNDETISKIDACTFNLDESGKIKVTDVSKSSIYIKKINKQALNIANGAGIQWFDDNSIIYKTAVAMPSGLPKRPITPNGPTIQQNIGKAAPGRQRCQ